jgi:hypothetical protein
MEEEKKKEEEMKKEEEEEEEKKKKEKKKQASQLRPVQCKCKCYALFRAVTHKISLYFFLVFN